MLEGRKIADRYMRVSFWVDLFSSIPNGIVSLLVKNFDSNMFGLNLKNLHSSRRNQSSVTVKKISVQSKRMLIVHGTSLQFFHFLSLLKCRCSLSTWRISFRIVDIASFSIESFGLVLLLFRHHNNLLIDFIYSEFVDALLCLSFTHLSEIPHNTPLSA